MADREVPGKGRPKVGLAKPAVAKPAPDKAAPTAKAKPANAKPAGAKSAAKKVAAPRKSIARKAAGKPPVEPAMPAPPVPEPPMVEPAMPKPPVHEPLAVQSNRPEPPRNEPPAPAPPARANPVLVLPAIARSRLTPAARTALFNRTLQQFQSGALAEAATSCKQMIEANGQDFDALHLGGVVALNQGDHNRALELIQRAVRLRPQDAQAQQNLGALYARLGRLGDAESCFRRALAIDPNLVDANSNLGLALASQSRHAEAIACYRQALAREPRHAETWSRLGLALAREHKLDEALPCFRQAVALRPSYGEGLAFLYHQLQHACEWAELPLLGARLDRATQIALAKGSSRASRPSSAFRAAWIRSATLRSPRRPATKRKRACKPSACAFPSSIRDRPGASCWAISPAITAIIRSPTCWAACWAPMIASDSRSTPIPMARMMPATIASEPSAKPIPSSICAASRRSMPRGASMATRSIS